VGVCRWGIFCCLLHSACHHYEWTPLDFLGRHAVGLTSVGLPLAQEGLAVLQADGKVFQCHHTIDDTVWHSELGASLAIMEVGCVYSIVFSYDTILRSREIESTETKFA